jgi:Ulp1 family protease
MLFNQLVHYIIKEHDYRTLMPGCWLNDQIVNGFAITKLITASSLDLSKVVFCDSFFFYRLQREGAKAKFTFGQLNIFTMHVMIVPVHFSNNHWLLIFVDMLHSETVVYDSLAANSDTRGAECLNQMKTFLDEKHQAFYNKALHAGWKFRIEREKNCIQKDS